MTIPVIRVTLGTPVGPFGTSPSINAEFAPGPTTPVSLNQYYRGGPNVPLGQGDAGFGLIASGPPGAPISMGPFRNQRKGFVFNDVITGNFLNYDLRARAIGAGWNQTVPLIASVIVASGVYVFSNNPNVDAFVVFGPFPAGSTVLISNNGVIAGCGGAGGGGGGIGAGGGGGGGGHGLNVNYPVTIINNAFICGGGGGGGGGGQRTINTPAIPGNPKTKDPGTPAFSVTYGGGGGGGGRVNAVGGGSPGGAAGAAASFTSPGAGGGGQAGLGGAGGAGGDVGSPGGAGQAMSTGGGPGGPSGFSVLGGGFITWYATGSRLGPVNSFGSNQSSSLTNGQAFSVVGDAPTTCVMGFTFTSTGTTAGSASSGNTVSVATPNWFGPTTNSIGVLYWVRLTVTASNGIGTLTGAALGTWIPLTNAVSINLSVAGPGTATRTFIVQFSNNASAVNSSHSLFIQAQDTSI